MPESLVKIAPSDFNAKLFHLFDKSWLLLTAGDFKSGAFNAMTVSWGSLGVIWGKPFAMVVARPQRHTLKFLKEYPSFTLTAFPESCRKALAICGAKSGRDGDKIKEAKLTPCPSAEVDAPSFEEAELVIECRKSYDGGTLDPKGFQFLETEAEVYPDKDFHHVFFGEIVDIRGVEKYLAKSKRLD